MYRTEFNDSPSGYVVEIVTKGSLITVASSGSPVTSLTVQNITFVHSAKHGIEGKLSKIKKK